MKLLRRVAGSITVGRVHRLARTPPAGRQNAGYLASRVLGWPFWPTFARSGAPLPAPPARRLVRATTCSSASGKTDASPNFGGAPGRGLSPVIAKIAVAAEIERRRPCWVAPTAARQMG